MLRLGLVTLAVVGTAMASAASAENSPTTRFSWQEPHAAVLPKGGSEGAIPPVAFNKGTFPVNGPAHETRAEMP